MMSPSLARFGAACAPDGTLVRDNFSRWFGASKLVDGQGAPMQFYHGTAKEFSRFDIQESGQKDSGWYGVGVYMTADPHAASAYARYESLKSITADSTGANVMILYARLQNPYLWEKGRKAALTPEESQTITRDLIALGHDGVIVSNEYADPLYASHYEVIAFSSDQVKSATGNSGLFDPDSCSLDDQAPPAGRQYEKMRA